ncbi:MAG: GlxA family transcriptional regulator [Chthoniobacterales bacterium]
MTYYSNFPPEEKPRKRVGFVAFDGVTTLDLTGPLDAFALARSEDGDCCYETVLIGVANKTFVAASGAMFKAQCTLKTAPALDTIIIPGGAALRQSETSDAIAAWLREHEPTTRRIASVSAGIYPLAQSGLIDGRHVTTHWRFAQNVAATFRGIAVNDTGSFINDGKFYTCGGGTAGIEMSLALIQEDCGARTALRLARELVVSLRPAGGDDHTVSNSPEQWGAEDRLAEMPAWITSRLRADLSVEKLAERACLCPRHFSRIFKRRFHITPAEFVEQLRVTEAARRLAAHNSTIDEIAGSVGFKSADVFRRAFERRYGIAPKRFQRQLRGEVVPPRKRHIKRCHRAAVASAN